MKVCAKVQKKTVANMNYTENTRFRLVILVGISSLTIQVQS